MKYLLFPLTLIIHVCLLLGNLFSAFWIDNSIFFYNVSSSISFMNDSGLALNNLGNLDYQKNDFSNAATKYQAAAARLNEPIPQASAYYNLGNSDFRLGQLELFGNTKTFFPLKETITISEAAKKNTILLWQNAISAYEAALKLTPNDKAVKENLDFVKKQLEYLLSAKTSKSSSSGNSGNATPTPGSSPSNASPSEDELKRIEDQNAEGQKSGNKAQGRPASGSSGGSYTGPSW